MIAVFMLLQATSTVIDDTRWIDAYSVNFDCQMAANSKDQSRRLFAKLEVEAGGEGSQDRTLIVDPRSDLLTGRTFSSRGLGRSSRPVSFSDDDGSVRLPWNMVEGFGRRTYPEVAIVFEAKDDNVLMAGPCKIGEMEPSQ